MTRFILSLMTLLTLTVSCCNVSTEPASRAEKLLAVLNDPGSDYVLVASHRGDWRNYPENSIPAIESAIRMGVDIIELDVKLTKDSVLVLSHDKTIDRTMKGHGLVSDFTLDSLKTFSLKRAHGIATDSVRIPTLREALLVCKDRALVNVDHAWDYYDEILAVTEELGVTGQVLMKGKKSIAEVGAKLASYENNLLYMPIIDINKAQGKELFGEYMAKGEVPIAYEICWKTLDDDAKECLGKVVETGSKLWVNTLWSSLCGGLDDDRAWEDGAAVYDQVLDLGATLIQTDRPEFLISYLRSRGLHD